MEIMSPAPLKSKFNRYSGSDIDYSMTNPLSTDGSNFPCKGYHNLLHDTAGIPVATYRGGETYSMTITGGAIHAGGSCQISLSVDGGQTFHVLHSFIGNCPSRVGESSYQFRVPVDVPSRERALLAWSWFNKLGNREMYMNCASVTTTGTGGSNDFSNRPTIFEANIGNGCKTAESTDVKIPNPGPETTIENANAVPPVGSCEVGSEYPSYPNYPGSPEAPEDSTAPEKPKVSSGHGNWDGSHDDHGGGGDTWKNWTPGNDWPDGFPGDAVQVFTDVYIGTLLCVLAYMIGLWIWL